MFKNFLRINLAALALTAVSGTLSSASAQSVTVIEYYNKPLDAYFITGRATEQQTLYANTDFQRTGMTFQAIAASAATSATTRICRFYVSTTAPFTSSHYYGREGTDCESLLAQNLTGFSYEGYDFAVEQPTGGICSANKVALYRSFRATAGGRTANHRYSASYENYLAAADDAYVGEGLVMCATSATDATPIAVADCGTFYYPAVRIGYKSLDSEGQANSWVRFMDATKILFNGVQAQAVVDQYASGATKTVMLDDRGDRWADLGYISQDGVGMVQTYYSSPTAFSRKMVPDQTTEIDRYAIYNPIQNFGSPQQTGQMTFVGSETVTVPAGIYKACKFTSEVTTNYAAISRTDVSLAQIWVAANVGIVKMKTEESTSSAFGGSSPLTTTETNATTVQSY